MVSKIPLMAFGSMVSPNFSQWGRRHWLLCAIMRVLLSRCGRWALKEYQTSRA